MIKISIIVKDDKIKYEYTTDEDTSIGEITLAVTYLELIKKWLLEELDNNEDEAATSAEPLPTN